MKSNTGKKTDLIRILNYISTALAVALLVTQFLPFWGCYQCSTCGEGQVLSIFQYVWFANNHSDGLTSVLAKYYIPGFQALDVVLTSALIQLGAVLAVIFSLLRPAKLSTALFPLIAGLACIIGYLAPAYQRGQSWQLHWVLGIATALCAIGVFITAFIKTYQKTKAEVIRELTK